MKSSAWRQRLLKRTRGKILELLRAQKRTVNELAEKLKLTDNAVRAHLFSLERDGLVGKSGKQPGIRRPHTTYELTAGAEQIFPKAYGPLLDLVVSVFSKKLTPGEIRAGMREVGRKMASDHDKEIESKTRAQRIKAALGILKDLGGSASFHESENKHFIQGNGCPLAAVTGHHPEACLIAESLLAEIIGAPVKERCTRVPIPSCRFEIG